MRRWALRIATALGVLLVLLLGYGVAIEPRLILDEVHEEATLPRLPTGAEPVHVAVLADFQVGMWMANTGMVERAVVAAAAEQPDAVLLAGDFLYGTGMDASDQIRTVLRLLGPLLDSGIPAFAVLGNHDYSAGAPDRLAAALQDRGVRVLRNEAALLERPGRPSLAIVGIGPVWPGVADVGAALRAVGDDTPRVVLMHNPTAFPDLPAGSAPLAVAGHTHCGQVALPGLPRWSWLNLTEEERTVADGWAAGDYGAEDNRLYVTCGIGFSNVPVRINAPPQVAFFTLGPPPAG